MVDELWQLEDDPTPTTSMVDMGGVRTGGPQRHLIRGRGSAM